jgi:anti-sigma factor RsiW
MELFHRVLDGDLMDAADRVRMESHLRVCSECAERAEQFREMQDLLRGMAERPMPEGATEQVWQRTVRAPRTRRRRAPDWRFAAAAAVVVLGAWIGVRLYPDRIDRVPPRAEAERAAREVRMVLQLTANALKRTEEVTLRTVFTEELSPALKKVGVTWPQAPARDAGDEG